MQSSRSPKGLVSHTIRLNKEQEKQIEAEASRISLPFAGIVRVALDQYFNGRHQTGEVG